MIMSVTDLKWEIDLFLFDSGFEKFWKMTPGTIIAILNPGIMPPSRGRADTGKFSMTVNSEADTILEVGTARDLGFCKSVKKDGKTCGSWVDKRHTEFCEYHVNEIAKKTNTKLMGTKNMAFTGGGITQNPNFMAYNKKAQGDARTRWDRASQSHIYVGGNASTAKLLDNVDYIPDAFHRGSTKEERVTRQILAKEKERELARKLGAMGGGLGADYMRTKDTTRPEPMATEYQPPTPPDAAKLGLLSGKAKDVILSPIKRKRTNTSSLTSTTAAMGWGKDLTKKLGGMKDGESLQPPVKKKTRFVTEKGIREAGRESFGGDLPKVTTVDDFDDDDDDDLDIIRD
jgi:minichromosome maintenance protein 10